MRVVQVTEFGGPEVLAVADIADPRPGAGQVLVRASAVDVLFLDTQLREGWGKEFFGQAPPYVPGDGVAGEVVSVGEAVDPGWIGRPVVASTSNGGTYAELVVVVSMGTFLSSRARIAAWELSCHSRRRCASMGTFVSIRRDAGLGRRA
ncbi:hypothetical protein SAMN05216215_107344 [Saccharopolyspora shandongensis]|uniref:Alcohol dehydrogenase-like N-terminal domain-containing protein n=1 Tax=Saccharopolyspora shandongensis TaxID=418495 RepID=A0A1H3T1T2_9PSEU|nr:hypothetical protein [Saccharopolyspora shandongensis]SDZ43848.1 hypothetical protein SAMN05216215_107344 [Saccharopolyspora shandongensis]